MLCTISPPEQPHFTSLLCAAVTALLFPLLVAYVAFVDRKLTVREQVRLGETSPNSRSLLQWTADTAELLLRPDVGLPKAGRIIFWVAPLIGVIVALTAYSVLPIAPGLQITDLNVGLLFVLAITSLGFYGSILSRRALVSRSSPYATFSLVGQLVSYQTAAVLGLLSALLLAGSLSMTEIVQAQLDQGQWFVFYVPVGFVIYFAGSMAATNHAQFHLPKLESENVAAFTEKRGGLRSSLCFLAEYMNLIVVAGIATTVFLGGWLRPLASYRDRFPGTSVELLDVLPAAIAAAIAIYCFRRVSKQEAKTRKLLVQTAGGFSVVFAAALLGALFAPEAARASVLGAFWFLVKVGGYIYCFLRLRTAFSQFDTDKSIQAVWRILIPLGFVNVVTSAMAILAAQTTGLPMRLTTIVATIICVFTAVWLAREPQVEPAIQTADGE